MHPERWRKIDALFHAALQVEPEQRASFLANACSGDEALQNEVESLISSHDQAKSFIETPAADLAADLLGEGQTTFAAGQSVGPYQIIKLLGVGGMGEVYLAEDTRLRRKIALKLLPRQFTLDEDRIRRFEQEARAASALNHPNLVTIHEIGQFNSTRFIVAEFVDGKTLRQLTTEQSFTLNEVINIAIQTAGALSAAHSAGIVHRDIKPENIMLRSDGYVKILDFGLAKLTEQLTTDTELESSTLLQSNPGLVMGTVQYMSPEQARGQQVDARTDIWSLGIVLYEMLAGRVPFSGETPSHVMVSVMEHELPPLSNNNVPPELDRIVTKSLKKQKRERYQTAADLLRDLKNFTRELEVQKLKRSLEPQIDDRQFENRTQTQKAVSSAATRVVKTRDLKVAGPTSGAQYLIEKIKRHRAAAVLAVTLIALSSIAGYVYYFSYLNRAASNSEVMDSVAVLPFVNATNDPNTEYLAEAMSDSLINSLSRLRELRVNSLNSVMRYKQKQVEAQAVGREMNVRAVLMGSVTQRGDDLLVSAELIDARDNRHLWGGRYSRKLSDVLVVQDEIARQVAASLRLTLTGQQQQQLAKRYTESTEAYHLYNLGNYYLRKSATERTAEETRKSIEYFSRAIEVDPNYALAYYGLFKSYFSSGAEGQFSPKELRPKIEWAALKAVELDDSLAAAHAALGFVKKMNWDWQGAEKEYQRAIELDPNGFDGYFGYHILLLNLGRVEEAMPLAKRAEDLDELKPPRKLLAFAYLYKRDFDAVIEQYRPLKQKNPDRGFQHLGEAYLGKGMYDAAVEELEKTVNQKEPASWRGYPVLAYAYAVAGQRDKAIKILNEQNKLAKQRYVSPFNFAIIYTGLGDKERAFEYLRKSIEERIQVLYHFPHRPIFDPLRSDPRYEQLLRKMNFPV